MNADHSTPKPLPDKIRAAIKEFRDWCGEHRKVEDNRNRITSPVYHYTDAAGLKGIIENQEIWFTSYTQLNDPGEITYGMEVARQLLEENGKDKNTDIKQFCDRIVNRFRPENVESILDFFIASLSRKGDDLGQWRGYGDNGRGYALGLAPHLFEATGAIKSNPTENILVVPVIYGKEEGRQSLMPAITKALEIVRRVIVEEATTMLDPAVKGEFLKQMAVELTSSELMLKSVMVKHQAYEQEAEVRLVIPGARTNFASHVSTRTRGAEIIPYIKGKFSLQAKGSIPEIVLGPAAPAGAEVGVKALLKFDPDINIRRSDIPYRPR